ncbi:CMP-N-acetylneuraminate-beta-galactosamide-alpha-2,3-sialyltransferase 1-like [Pempheris klunzingeri]|uniref:CMP-N-acetylneuraminate-beta-galactosamide- alpha-2,3-sialyltransferase 1-like n=1 Tax=Pempheris klunzingeri TaxID=3127111 RepID=UPI00397FAA1F
MNSKVKALVFLLCVTGVGVYLRAYVPHYSQLQDTRLCACEKCLTEDDPWFMQRFQKSIEPFLSGNYSLPEDAFNWWRRLQHESRNYNFYNETVASLFQTIPPRPDLTEPSPDRCRTCSVVGNSINLKGSRYGPLIDFHDVVIRMNHGRINGFEEDVGTRTTHRVMYPESAGDLDNSTHLVLFAFKIMDIQWITKAFTTGFFGKSYAPVKSHIKANKDLVMVLNPAFMKYVHEAWLQKRGSYPSTGFMALILALHICDEVHVFGYGADSEGNWSHYWEILRNKHFRTGGHPGAYEYQVINELAKQQKLKFYKGR